MVTQQGAIRGTKLILIASALWFGLGVIGSGPATAGGLIAYEVGTADVGLASAGYNTRAQDASTVFTNPAGMTRLEGTQFLAAGQLDYGTLKFSPDWGTSPALGSDDGGRAFGSDGWFFGGGGFFSYSVSPDFKLGFAMTGNFGAPPTLRRQLGRPLLRPGGDVARAFDPALGRPYKVTDKLSLGASLNAMYGIYKNQVAINNTVPIFGDGQVKLDYNAWGWGVNLGLLYEINADVRLGLTWNSQVNLDFKGGRSSRTWRRVSAPC